MELSLATIAVLLLSHIDFVLTECPSECTSCSGSACKNCAPSYYLSGGKCFPCQEHCISCTDHTNCTKCEADKWGIGFPLCLKDCNEECLNGECHDDTGYCLNCEDGKYGSWCQNNCSDCKNENCDLYRCVEGCKSGYFEYQTFSNDNFCQNCPHNCKLCDDGTVCRICNDGFFLNAFYHNNNTHVNCAKCPNENECSNFCLILGCNQCQIINNLPMCADCPEGETFNGVSCEPISNQCPQGCSTNCNKNGICLGKCTDGWAGESCTERCNEKCLLCSKNDRNICEQCQGDFYSNDCSLSCSQSCNIEDGKSTCSLNDGYCFNGCERDYWGDTCNNSCPEGCQDQDCDRSNGTCTRGCKEGYTGGKCVPITTINQEETPVTIKTTSTSMKATLNTTTLCTPNQASDDKVIITIIGFFSGVGFSLVIVAIVKLLYYIRRRYLGNKTAQNNSRNVEIPTYTESANNYESLSHNRTRDNMYSDLGTTE